MCDSNLISLHGKTALITGAASGLGLGTAELLSAHGAKVAMIDINPNGEREAERLRELGHNVCFFRCDVRVEEQVKKTVGLACDKFGGIDILFNNAGVVVRKTLKDLSEEEWDRVIDVTLKGAFLVSKHVIPVMEKRGGGSIVNTGSGWGLKGGDMAPSYCAAKGGIVNLTRAMAIDHGPANIRVNCVCPGDTDTAMLRDEGWQIGAVKDDATMKTYLEDCAVGRPLGRIGQPLDIAKAVLFFASDMSLWVTGTALSVDGGGNA